MATIKMQKILTEIEKAKEKLAEQQAKVRELENKKIELENLEIVDTIRGMNIPLDKLAAFMESVKEGAHTTSGQKVHKSKPEAQSTDDTEKEIENE